MTVVYLSSLIAGLLLGVRFMMFGVEREPQARADVAPEHGAPVRLALPAVAAFTFIFGVFGYALSRSAALSPATVSAIAVVAGLASAAGVVFIITRTARVIPKYDILDPRYALQGQLAQVVRPISLAEEGAITFEEGDTRRTVRARSVSDAVGVGMDVVIDRIEDDVAYVEPWHQVEKRL